MEHQDIQTKVNSILKKYGLNYDTFFESDKCVCISVFWGDWKHDHLCLKHVMREGGFILTNEIITDSDCDCYDAEYRFELP